MTEARFRITSWQRAREAVAAQMAALEKLRRGHQLGEMDLADLLLGERMSVAARFISCPLHWSIARSPR